MRKLMLVALALVIGTASTFANNEPELDKKDVRNQIVALLDAPTFALDSDMKVEISFTFSSEGEIVVLKVNSTNSDVLNYVRENLNYKKIQNPGERNKIYTMPLKIEAA